MTIEATNPETEVEEEPVVETPESDLETEGEGGKEPEPEETEEVEHDGKKYKIPKPLKGALLMQADYTRKTQEVAEQRRAIEERQKAFADEQKAQTEHLSEYARVVAYNDAIAQFEKADWPQIRANNPAMYDQLWFQYQQTKEARDKAVTTLQTKVQEGHSKAQQETARRLEEARTAIQRDIPEWSPELAAKLNGFATSQGFTADELRQVTDPRIVKLIHTAMIGHQLQQKQAAGIRAAPATAAKPLPTVSGNAPAKKGLSDELSTEEWLRRRNEQVRKKRAP